VEAGGLDVKKLRLSNKALVGNGDLVGIGVVKYGVSCGALERKNSETIDDLELLLPIPFLEVVFGMDGKF
jgi:hypothetical protein